MERLQIREFSRLLAQHTHISIGDAEKFVNEFFATIANGMKADGEVEIYGFGVFRREQTEQGVKVDFTPCPEMCDAVNKPFVNFQPISVSVDLPVDEVINEEEIEEEEDTTEESTNEDAVVGEDSADEGKSPVEDAENMEGAENSKRSENSEIAETSERSENSEIAETSERSGNSEISEISETSENSEFSEHSEHSENSTGEGKSRNYIKIWLSAVTVILLMVVVYIAGNMMFAGDKSIAAADSINAGADTVKAGAGTMNASADSLNAGAKKVYHDLSDEEKLKLVGKGVEGAEEIPASQSLSGAKAMTKYAGCKIVGTLRTVDVRAGQSLKDIATSNGLGNAEFLIQVHNAVEGVREGQHIRIPQLEYKEKGE